MPTYTGVSVSLVYPIVKTIVIKGHDKADFFRRANIDESFLHDTEARLSGEDLERMTELAAAITSDEMFGLHQGQNIEVSDLGILGYVMLHSKTIGQALAAYQKYNVIVCNGYNISWEVEGNDVIITMSSNHVHRQPARHCMEDMGSSLYHLMIRLSCRPISLKEVDFTHALSSELEAYRSVLGITPRFGKDANTIRMSKDVLEYPILFADPKLLGTFEVIAEEARQRFMRGRVFSDQLYNWIIKCMPMYFPSLKDTARAFKMSVRSIQAKLKQEDTTYQDLIHRVRRELAVGYLAKAEYKVAEVAYLLHFSEPSAFQSAFKKWTGVTPRQYRMDLISGRLQA
ncbi:AraC family transcriptional regulator [Paenibacillus sp. SYP-B3998]|uniref:AraC family transcriptional regulator n=1 Tax=Paenibacillus sp. SYP-B3998 TaxID=2678564 RepID=UPI001F07143F|nr:AraC family transcriptional regulator [Paenibacillus sp. SYP-B3998]